MFFRLFDKTSYFCAKRFLQTVFGNDVVGSYFVQRHRNIAAAAPLSGWFRSRKVWSERFPKMITEFFLRTPNPSVQSEQAGFNFRIC